MNKLLKCKNEENKWEIGIDEVEGNHKIAWNLELVSWIRGFLGWGFLGKWIYDCTNL